jgi:lipid-A-disaccharide synthase-like uncharacterized protein
MQLDPTSCAAVVLAFQIWDGIGWLGQALFTLRVLVQWIASERAGRSVVPGSFWWLSLAGSLALVAYVLHRRDPVFLVGVSINTAIYVRNLQLMYKPAPRQAAAKPSPWVPVGLGLGATLGVGFILWRTGTEIVSFEIPLPWLALGFLGQAIWSSRFIVQWYASERAGRSVLPASFFLLSTAGALLLFVYAVYRVDWVMMAAFALNPIPYVRNLMLLHRAGQQDGGDEESPPSIP